MSKKVLVLAEDYWHHMDSISPMLPLVFDSGYDVIFTADPSEFYNSDPALTVSFKDPIENDQIPTPIWCGDKWTELFLNRIKNGMGFIGVHAGITDLPEDHPITKEVIRGTFISHPAPCGVKFVPCADHPLLEGIDAFEFPAPDEHYVMKMYDEYPTAVLANTESANGIQPALWAHGLGKGKICCITPSHATENLTCQPFVKLMKNAVGWCTI